ncbi:succinate dehydrogenase/fumarate reductase iron-sulfur subunit [Prochlorococcus marinus]|uniref:succinate dehydrogenase/fumarate reductase iron-sulfur subunit n=1 Tax=Prochlorococcus marinus TaxID=1219 RepID=UPI0022B4F284|nr:succinate dehydrogenase/fumarate reductase iron-sulfur subunit [Prochlorococcus marinus]
MKKISLVFRIWRQKSQLSKGQFVEYTLKDLSTNLSLLEALDKLNEELILNGDRPINFDHDCREGICGSCGFLVNGQPHGPKDATTICQLYLRNFKDHTTLTLEPLQTKTFPVIQDLVVDRSSLDRLIMSGGFCSDDVGKAPDANFFKVNQTDAFSSFQTATCIGCGACIASCRNASASLFVAAKLAHLGQLPQGQLLRSKRASQMKHQMLSEGFGSCSNNLDCEAACPKEISANWISWMNREDD